MDRKTVAVVKCGNYEENEVRAAFDALFENGIDLDFVKPGMKVAIKANLVTAMKPDKAATTHPALVAELCRRLCEKGAEVVVGDSPGGPFTGIYLKGVYSATGMHEVEKYGAKCNDCFDTSHCEHFEEAVIMKDFEYTSWLKNADCVINFAKLKTHGMMGLSACVKNLFGAIPGTMKPEYHYRFANTHDFAEMLIDIDEFFGPVLNIVDGIVGMEGNGPTMGTPRKVGLLIAGASPYNVDAVCARTVGLSPENIPTLELAEERKLGDKYEELDLRGDGVGTVVSDYKNVDRPNDVEYFTGLIGLKGNLINKILKKALCTRPLLKKSECVGCKKCQSICPAGAITMKNGKPSIDRSKCIRCFCCQEFCPKGALKVHRPLPARVLAKIK